MTLTGGRRRKGSKGSKRRRGGNLAGVASRAAVPFGLFALSNYLGKDTKRRGTKRRGTRRGTRKGMRRKSARRAYMA